MSKNLTNIDLSDLLNSSAPSDRCRQHSCALIANRYLLPSHKDEPASRLVCELELLNLIHPAGEKTVNLHTPLDSAAAHDTPLCAPGPWWSSGNAAGRREGSGPPPAKATRVSGVLSPIFWSKVRFRDDEFWSFSIGSAYGRRDCLFSFFFCYTGRD